MDSLAVVIGALFLLFVGVPMMALLTMIVAVAVHGIHEAGVRVWHAIEEGGPVKWARGRYGDDSFVAGYIAFWLLGAIGFVLALLLGLVIRIFLWWGTGMGQYPINS